MTAQPIETESATEICQRCDGSGEGMTDGSTCQRCGGSGDQAHPWGLRDYPEIEREDYER